MRSGARYTRAQASSRQPARRLVAILVLTVGMAAAARVEAASLPLTWNAPTTNADGSPLTDLAHYRLYLGTSAPACPGASFHTVATPTSAPSAGQVVSTRVTGLGAGTTYFARVTAVDSSGNESGCSSSASGAAQADFTVSPTGTTSFGSVAVNDSVDRTFTVQNTSTASLSVSVSVGAPFSLVSGGSFSLAGGASQNVTVRFRPTTVGSFAGNVSVTAGGDTLTRAVSGSSTAAASVMLTVTKNGTGAGTVSSPAGIACGGDCSESLAVGTPVTLTAAAAAGSTFAGWGGACSGTTASCTVTVSAATAVTATFSAVPVRLSVTRTGTGTGAVTSVPTGISCGADCAEEVAPGSPFTLTAAAAPGSVFAGWSGGCSGTATSCTVTVSTATTVTATFNLVPVGLTVTKNGTGTGTVSSSPAGIACGADCGENVTPGTQMTLTATPSAGSTFAGWGGACSGTGSCVVTVNAATMITATFNLAPVSLTVTKTGTGTGTVTSSPTGITCGASCTAAVPAGTAVTLAASPASGSVFAGWSGGPCSGTGPCSLSPSGPTTVTATFNANSIATPPSAAPVLTRLSPTSRVAGSPAFYPLTVRGSGFTRTSVVRWNGVDRATTFVSSSRLRIAVTAGDQASPGVVPISVATPGGGSSSTLGFTVTSPAPVLSSLSPSTAVAGTGGFTLTVVGSGFVPASVVTWGGASRTTTFVSPTRLTAAISAADLATAGTVAVRVASPAPGGGTSGSRSFTITRAVAPTPAPPPAQPEPAPTPTQPPTVLTPPWGVTTTLRVADATGVTFDIAWPAVHGAVSYRYAAAYSDGTASQRGTVTGLLTLQLRMPYHRSGAATGGFVCLRSVDGSGQLSADQACAPLSVPAP